MEHTPGPWKVERTIKGLYYIYHHLRRVAYAMALPDEQETKANANLIAAAPDLLAALELASKIILINCGVKELQIENAIAKAKGQEDA